MALNRRDFLKNGTAGLAMTGASFLFPMELLAAMRKKVGPNDTINIGLNWLQGYGFLRSYFYAQNGGYQCYCFM